MFHLVLVLLIALLPLRGWAADSMATRMAAPGSPTMDWTAAHHAVAADPSAESAPCAGHDAPAVSEAGGHADCDTCAACLTCHAPALAPAVGAAAGSEPAHVRPPAQPAAFVSAAPHRGLKPPIS